MFGVISRQTRQHRTAEAGKNPHPFVRAKHFTSTNLWHVFLIATTASIEERVRMECQNCFIASSNIVDVPLRLMHTSELNVKGFE